MPPKLSTRLFTVSIWLFAAACSGAPPCSPSTCTTCCTAAGECVMKVSASSCGASGATCTPCGTKQTCSVAGVCTDGPGGNDRIAGPNAFAVASVLVVTGGVVLTDDASGRADYCAGRHLDDFHSIAVVRTSSGAGNDFRVGNGSVEGEVRYQVRMAGSTLADVAGTGTASLSMNVDAGTVIGSFDVVFPGQSERTTGVFGGRVCP